MALLKTLFWVLLLIAFAVFAANNWQPVTVKLWSDLWLDTKLPALVGLTFLCGFVPLWIWHRTALFRLRRQIGSLQSAARTPLGATAAPPAAEAVP